MYQDCHKFDFANLNGTKMDCVRTVNSASGVSSDHRLKISLLHEFRNEGKF